MSDQNPQTNETTTALTPELVREVADKVLAMLREDLKLARERLRPDERQLKTRHKGIR